MVTTEVVNSTSTYCNIIDSNCVRGSDYPSWQSPTLNAQQNFGCPSLVGVLAGRNRKTRTDCLVGLQVSCRSPGENCLNGRH